MFEAILFLIFFGPVLLAALVWFAKSPGAIVAITLMAALPLAWLWKDYAEQNYHLLPRGGLGSGILPDPGWAILLVVVSAALRAQALGFLRLGLVLGGAPALLLVAAVFLPGALTKRNWERGVVALAEDRQFLLGGQTLILPRVAISGAVAGGHVIRHSYPTATEGPVRAEFLKLKLSGYATLGESRHSEVICHYLSREWARELCRQNREGLYGELPHSVALATGLDAVRAFYGVSASHWETAFHKAFGAEGLERGASLFCDPAPVNGSESGLCAAALNLGDGVVALWEVRQDARHLVDRQAEALLALYRFGLGEQEAVGGLRASGT